MPAYPIQFGERVRVGDEIGDLGGEVVERGGIESEDFGAIIGGDAVRAGAQALRPAGEGGVGRVRHILRAAQCGIDRDPCHRRHHLIAQP